MIFLAPAAAAARFARKTRRRVADATLAALHGRRRADTIVPARSCRPRRRRGISSRQLLLLRQLSQPNRRARICHYFPRHYMS